MLDIANHEYWIDENGEPLSALEIRQRGADMRFCAPVLPGENTEDTRSLKEKHMGDMKCLKTYTAGETEPHMLRLASFGEETQTR